MYYKEDVVGHATTYRISSWCKYRAGPSTIERWS